MNEFRAAENFLFAGRVREVVPYGNGHINDTYAVTCDCDCGATLRATFCSASTPTCSRRGTGSCAT